MVDLQVVVLEQELKVLDELEDDLVLYVVYGKITPTPSELHYNGRSMHFN